MLWLVHFFLFSLSLCSVQNIFFQKCLFSKKSFFKLSSFKMSFSNCPDSKCVFQIVLIQMSFSKKNFQNASFQNVFLSVFLIVFFQNVFFKRCSTYASLLFLSRLVEIALTAKIPPTITSRPTTPTTTPIMIKLWRAENKEIKFVWMNIITYNQLSW